MRLRLKTLAMLKKEYGYSNHHNDIIVDGYKDYYIIHDMCYLFDGKEYECETSDHIDKGWIYIEIDNDTWAIHKDWIDNSITIDYTILNNLFKEEL